MSLNAVSRRIYEQLESVLQDSRLCSRRRAMPTELRAVLNPVRGRSSACTTHSWSPRKVGEREFARRHLLRFVRSGLGQMNDYLDLHGICRYFDSADWAKDQQSSALTLTPSSVVERTQGITPLNAEKPPPLRQPES